MTPEERRPFPAFQSATGAMLLGVARLGCRRWLIRPWQTTIAHAMLAIVATAVALTLRAAPAGVIVGLLVLALAGAVAIEAARSGARRVDVLAAIAIVATAVALSWSAMRLRSEQTAGRSFNPVALPMTWQTLIRAPE